MTALAVPAPLAPLSTSPSPALSGLPATPSLVHLHKSSSFPASSTVRMGKRPGAQGSGTFVMAPTTLSTSDQGAFQVLRDPPPAGAPLSHTGTLVAG